MQERSHAMTRGAAAPEAGDPARAGPPTAAEQAAASPLLRALVARYLTTQDRYARVPPGAPPEV